jgi:hypothetical protein
MEKAINHQGSSMSELIVYDATPAPGPGVVETWAAALDLPTERWTVVRRLLGRVVAIGESEAGQPTWVLRAGRGAPHPLHFARAAANATLLARFCAVHPTWLAAADPSSLRLGTHEGVSLLATPYVPGMPLAPERRLSSAEARALGAEIPTLGRLITAMEAFTPAVSLASFDRAAYVARCVARVEERLAHLVAVDGLALAEAKRIGSDFAARLAGAELAPTFCHGELTGWHLLRRLDGRFSLIDLESMGARHPRHVDDSVFVMRTWCLNGAPAIAQAFLEQRRADFSARARAAYDAELAWHWPYSALRTRAESLAWADRSSVRSFWSWAIARGRARPRG